MFDELCVIIITNYSPDRALSNKVNTVFLMLVLVLGLASYPTLQPNFGSNFDAYDQSHLQLASLAFAQEEIEIELEEEIEIELEEEIEIEQEENGSEEVEEENGSEEVEEEIGSEEEVEEAEDEEEEEIEIEVEVEDGVAKVKVKFNDQKHRIIVESTDEADIAAAILALPGFPSEINPMDIWDFEVEDEIDSTSTTTTAFNEWEAQQTSQEMYDDLQQKYDELKEQMQILMAMLDSGEYYGNVPEVDSEINSYTISFTGSATSTDDDSIVDAEGEIYIESLMTGESASKYTVTGGEITIDDTFYEYVFGKVRVSSGNMIIIGQVLDWTGDDDSTTIKLVIHSDMPLGGDFGSEPIDVEILPQSKIAGQWHLSGTGSLSII